MCAGDELDFLVPLRVAALFGRALRVASEEAGRPLSPGEGLVRMARHFVETWGPKMAQVHPRRRGILPFSDEGTPVLTLSGCYSNRAR